MRRRCAHCGRWQPFTLCSRCEQALAVTGLLRALLVPPLDPADTPEFAQRLIDALETE